LKDTTGLVRAILDDSVTIVASRKRTYYCGHCKKNLTEIDVNEKIELTAKIIDNDSGETVPQVLNSSLVEVNEVVTVTCKKCKNEVKERFWLEPQDV